MEELQKIINRVDELTLRERAIILAGLLIVLFLGWYSYLMEPLALQEKNLLAELDQKHRQLQILNDQFELLTRSRSVDPDAEAKEQLAKLRAEDTAVAKQVQSTTSTLISPDQMPDVLRKVLQQSDGLDLLAVKGLGSSPLVATEKSGSGPARNGGLKGEEGTNSGPDNEQLGNAYKHGLEIQFSGSFFATLQYMRKLEKLPWGFFWDGVELDVKDYPQATASIRLFTLSLDSGWIGT